MSWRTLHSIVGTVKDSVPSPSLQLDQKKSPKHLNFLLNLICKPNFTLTLNITINP